jgi:ABC-type sulfate/molybdate transport systems ATPase subunit
VSDPTLHARLLKSFPPSAGSAAFSLDVEIEASPGVTVLYGASGSGKTLTLDCISGFIKPDSGRILLDDRILYDGSARVNVPARERRCGYVFQNYALFPQMTLRENLAFAAEGRPRLDRHRFVNEMLERFHISEFAARFPHEVSGGQKQRCSIARTLVANPKLLLLDEPARGLDATLRNDLYTILRELRADYRIPILLVTHDLEECFVTGDALLIYIDGKIRQSGEPRRVLDHPASVEIARLLGYANIFEGEILGLDPGRNTSRLRALGQELTGPYYPGRFIGDRVWLCAQAADLRLYSQPAANRVPAKLMRISERPHSIRAEFSLDLAMDLSRQEYERHRDNQAWFLEFPAEALKVAG